MLIGNIKQIWRYPVKSMGGESLTDCVVSLSGIPGDRGWALRDEANQEITNGKRLPLLMQAAAHYRELPANGSIPHVQLLLPNSESLNSDDPDINTRLSAWLGKSVSLWPLQPAENLDHYRRKSKAARILGRFAKYRAFRRALPALTSFGKNKEQLMRIFSREPGEPIPDLSTLPPAVIEFTSPPGTYFDAFPLHVLTTASLETMTAHAPLATWDVRRFRPNFLIQTIAGIEGLVESEWLGRTLKLGSVELRCEVPAVRCGMTTHAQKELPRDSTILRTIVKEANQNFGTYANVLTPGTVSVGTTVELL